MDKLISIARALLLCSLNTIQRTRGRVSLRGTRLFLQRDSHQTASGASPVVGTRCFPLFYLVLIFVPFLGTQSFSYLNVVHGSNPGPDAGPDAGPIPVLIIIPAAFLVSTPLSGPLSGPGPRQGPEPRKIPQLHPYPSTPPHPHANAYARLHPRSARDLIPTSVLTPMPGWTLLLPVVLLPSLNLPLFLFLALSLPLVLFLPPFLMPILPLPPILPLLLPLSPTLTLPLSPPLPLAVLLLLALP